LWYRSFLSFSLFLRGLERAGAEKLETRGGRSRDSFKIQIVPCTSSCIHTYPFTGMASITSTGTK
jgi:hypothetical protein